MGNDRMGLRYPRVIGGIWLALGSFLLIVAAAGTIQGLLRTGNWSSPRDLPLILCLLAWVVAAMLGGGLLLWGRTAGQIWIALASVAGVVLIARRFMQDPAAVYYSPVLTGILVLVLTFSVYCLVAVALSGWELHTGRCNEKHAMVEWGATLVAVTALLGAAFAPVLGALAQQTSVARWWRCRESPRPLLDTADGAWTVTYSWTPGLGPGRVQATIQSDGRARIEAQRNGESAPQVRDARLSSDILLKLAHAIDDTGLLCETPKLRMNRIWDLGRFAIQVQHGAYNKEIYIDECHRLEDNSGLSVVAQILQAQEQALGAEIRWGPYGAASGEPPCAEVARVKGK
jgi:hypothetical protein